MHENRIMHGDVKPSNVLVLKGGDVRIIDFDCSVRLTPETCNDGVRQYAGTEGYMAPEVAAPRGERRYGLPSDVYSCGVVLREFAHFMRDGCKVRRGLRLPCLVVALALTVGMCVFAVSLFALCALCALCVQARDRLLTAATKAMAGKPGDRPTMCQLLGLLSAGDAAVSC